MDPAASNPQRKNLIVADAEMDGISKPRVEFIWEGHDQTCIPEARQAAD